MFDWITNRFTHKYKVKIKELNEIIDIKNMEVEVKDAEINRLGLILLDAHEKIKNQLYNERIK